MEDDNGLELSLGLSCGKSSGKTKVNNNGGSSFDNYKAKEDNKSSKVSNDFKNFLQPSSDPSFQRTDTGRSSQNFFSDLSKVHTTDAETSTKLFWVEKEPRKETVNKRSFFPELTDEEKNKDLNIDLHEKKTKTSHVSVPLEERSLAENQDVADSKLALDNTSSASFVPAKDINLGAISPMQPTNLKNLPILFGYSPGQIPVLDNDRSQGIISLSNLQFVGKSSSNSGEEKLQQGAMATDRDSKSSLVFDLSAIKPGMAADMKFKGSETCPNLPWVSTTGSGPHGRTISGVTYRYNENEIRIVCACHNSHMLPEEFVLHASQEWVNPETTSIGLTRSSTPT